MASRLRLSRIVRALVHRSPLQFVRTVKDYQARLWQPGESEAAGHAGVLQRDGLVVLESQLSRDEVAVIRAAIDPLVEAAHAGDEISNRVLDNGIGSVIVESVDENCDAIRTVLASHGVTTLVAEAAGAESSPTLFRAELKRPTSGDKYPVNNPEVDMWHVDHWAMRTKVMVYLDEVGVANAPLHYVVGSHRQLGWGRRWVPVHWLREFLMMVGPVSAGLVRLWNRAATSRSQDVHVCTGTAGSVVVFDTRGLHRGSSLEAGERRILNIGYQVDDLDA